MSYPSTLPPAGDAAQLLAKISRELRSPLNGIIGGLELLKDTGLTPEQRRYVDLVNSGAETLLELIASIPELPPGAAEPRPAAPEPPARPEAGAPLRVLVAEESRFNQMIAVEQLGRLGFQAETVGSGAAMLERLKTGEFDVVLLDCRMPDAEPCLTAMEIRRREGLSPARRLRIVGIAPENRAGERERCLAAGMDGFLTKPLRLDDLRQVLLSLRLSASGGAVVDPEQLELLRTESPGLLERLTALFRETVEKAFAEMAAAASRGDRKSIASAAHLLKGSASNFGALRMMAACQALEQAVQGSGADVQKYLDGLRNEYQPVIQALQEYGRSPGMR